MSLCQRSTLAKAILMKTLTVSGLGVLGLLILENVVNILTEFIFVFNFRKKTINIIK